MGRKTAAAMARMMVLGVGAIALWGVAPGCGGASVGKYCDQVCECLGCSDSERDECSDAMGDLRKTAEDAGCSGEFDDYLSCINDELECNDDQVSADGCDVEEKAVGECSPDIGIGVDPCERLGEGLTALYESCGVEVTDPGGETTECTGQVAAQAECLLPCIDLLPCECIDPDQSESCQSEQLQSYIECVSACQ